MGRWIEAADGVLVRRYEELDLSVGLVVGDVTCLVVDSGAVFAGDLVEQGAPPQFDDAFPQSWPAALDGILALDAPIVLPGHGNPVDRDFVRGQRAELVLVAELCREVSAGTLTAEQAVARSPYPEEFTLAALAR
ncbi:hypothetical protein [Promicromonospora panici]|uniref:hypothetical protein n=1 Tax=Promicromonospora panici TaxID=2219658 RepID=UPI00101C5812|nr:hypothetical protein [Promicromonospora panici]